MILITTAGKVGAEAARLLAQRGEPVRVLVRDPEKATALAQPGVDVAVGDLGVPATIDAAMRGISAVVLVSPAITVQELNVVASAVTAWAPHSPIVTPEHGATAQQTPTEGRAATLRELAAQVAHDVRCRGFKSRHSPHSKCGRRPWLLLEPRPSSYPRRP